MVGGQPLLTVNQRMSNSEEMSAQGLCLCLEFSKMELFLNCAFCIMGWFKSNWVLGLLEVCLAGC